VPEVRGLKPGAGSRCVVRPALSTDLAFIIQCNCALAEESEGLQLDASVLREGVLALLDGRAPGRYFIAERAGRPIGQTMITYEWSDWRNRMVWWIQSVYVVPPERRSGVFREIYAHIRQAAHGAGAGGLRLYVHTANARAQAVYASLGMDGGHYRVFEDMF
jgi:GNAT superfamily N-acetyltransferase